MSVVFQHMMDQPLGSTDESRAMSLMGADIEMLAEYLYSVACETWANVLQLALATWLLETEVGAVCIAPILVVVAFTTCAFAMENTVSSRQRDWLQATEKRITFTNSIMGSIRNVKFLGISEIMSSKIEGLRKEELEIPKKFRRIQSIRVCMINAPLAIEELFVKYPDIAFCDDTPWLSNASIRSNIIGENPSTGFDPEWYRTVVNACALDIDLMKMPAGDQTLVGSKGSKLSGGQRQRIAIARAVYARRRVACFDDVLSGLDNSTARTVFNNVFGSTGLLRRLSCSVFLATHSTFFLPQADLIMILGENGQVFTQGNYSQVQDKLGDVFQRNDSQPIQVDGAEDDIIVPTVDHLTPISDTASPIKSKPPTSNELSVYKDYFSALGWPRIAVLIFVLCVEAGTSAFRYVWVSMWSSSDDSTSRLGYWLGLYGMLSVMQTVSLVIAVLAPMSFLSSPDTGSLITRFSQDMRLVDMILPRAFIWIGFQFFGAIAQGATTIVSLPCLAATLPLLFGVLYSIQKVLSSNVLSAPITRVAGLTVLLVGLSIPFRSHMDPGLLGIVLVMMMNLGLVLSELIQNWTLLETSLGAISRIKDFAEQTPHEEIRAPQTQETTKWLVNGEIKFLDTSIAWNSSDPNPLLKGINLQIGAGQKFGLCGRTGSGKSTLALSLLRLNELVSGQILIDGQDISLLSRSSIRDQISCLSQEPFIFHGTVRENLDPWGKIPSAQIVDALQSVGIWSVLETHSSMEVLDAKLDESILSQGQKQLFCLARSLLKRSKILILDEPTSSLDPETEAKVQNVIREVFSGCTVIMVARRIHTLLDFDQVAVLKSGEVVEVGNPHDLLRKPDAEFTRLFALES
ncbi:hypothetical protein N7493_007154 [Penicillium malachiteum]|uniref:Uncharacterized protein n=1 Tax=Penicillium malachiteum TaxID=1324776 RepID=A0AAD6MUP1_9EURO|nr:hypothetical protein N7493_007154 [Penicillium malachiteum]